MDLSVVIREMFFKQWPSMAAAAVLLLLLWALPILQASVLTEMEKPGKTKEYRLQLC